MAQVEDQPLLRFLRGLRDGAADSTEADAVLLRRYLREKDEQAFAVLLDRHARMVFNVCARILENRADAEDAFQAVFLVLAQRGHTLKKQSSLASWLHGIALRASQNLKQSAAVRHKHESQQPIRAAEPPSEALVWRDLRPILDQEIAKLPERYRQPVLLCYLEGKTNDDAADLLGCTRGTLAGRLSRARQLLQGRLSRRGITASMGILIPLLSQRAASAQLPSKLAFDAAVSERGTMLAQQVIGQLVRGKLIFGVGAVLMSLGLLGGTLMFAGETQQPTANQDKEKMQPSEKNDPTKRKWNKVRVLTGHEKGKDVWSVAFSPDGKLLASGAEDKTVRVWDVATGKAVMSLKGHADEVSSVAFSPDGKTLISGGWDHKVSAWDVRRGGMLWTVRVPQQAQRVNAVAVSPDGKQVAFGDKGGSLHVVDAETGRMLISFQAQESGILSLVYSPDGQTVLAGREDVSVLRFYPVAPPHPRRIPLKTPDRDTHALALSPDGKQLASGGSEGVVHLWDLSKAKPKKLIRDRKWGLLAGDEPKQLKGHERGEIISLAYSPDGKFIASGGKDKTVRVWDLSAGGNQVIPLEGRAPSVSFSPDGRLLAVATDNIITLYQRR